MAKGQKTGGRQKGAPNKKVMALSVTMQETARKVQELLPAAFEGDAHALLMMIYKDENAPIDKRLSAATAAIGYEKNKLASIAISGDPNKPAVKHEHRVRVEIVRPSPTGS